jgi:hypothetical protein
MLRTVIAVVLFLVFTNTSFAQWLETTKGSDFEESPMHIALTAQGGYGLGLKCQGNAKTLLFLTPEKLTDKALIKMMNTVGVKLRIRVDGGKILNLDAQADTTDEGNLKLSADADPSLFAAFRDAKSRISVVMTALDKNFHETTFNTRGSSKALGKIMNECKID